MRINKAGLTETVVVTAALVPGAPIHGNTFPARQRADGDLIRKTRWRRHEHV